MTDTTTTLIAPLATLPPRTPKWLIHAVAAAVALVPILLALWQPRGAFTTPASQAAIVLAGIVVAAGIFVVTVAAESFAHYGLTKAAILATVSASEAELKQLLPEAKQLFATARPLVDQLGGANDLITGLQSTVADVQAKLEQIPAGQRQAAIEALTGLLASNQVNAGPVSPPLVTMQGASPVPTPADPGVAGVAP